MPLEVDLYAELSVHFITKEEGKLSEWFADHYLFKLINGDMY